VVGVLSIKGNMINSCKGLVVKSTANRPLEGRVVKWGEKYYNKLEIHIVVGENLDYVRLTSKSWTAWNTVRYINLGFYGSRIISNLKNTMTCQEGLCSNSLFSYGPQKSVVC